MSKSSTRAKKNQSSEYIFFVSGGALKANQIYVGWCSSDVETFARDNLTQYFTKKANGKAYACEDAETKFTSLLEHEKRADNSNILEISIKEAQDFMKKVLDNDKAKANNFKLTDEITPKKSKAKPESGEDTDAGKKDETDNNETGDESDVKASANTNANASANTSSKKKPVAKKQQKKDEEENQETGDESDNKKEVKKKSAPRKKQEKDEKEEEETKPKKKAEPKKKGKKDE
jgi:hypothetical protein